MLLSRVLDDKMSALSRGGKINGGVFLGRGQEALSVSLGMALQKGDVFAPLIRDFDACSDEKNRAGARKRCESQLLVRSQWHG
jgi:TPP-dependent pyruvate/acetoin dehydrogenase alpha subunit